MVTAIIPARGGSKRIPNKNMRLFHGIPIIGRVIKNLERNPLISQIVVSTDSNEIAEYSRSIGAKVPFIRPSHLSGDHVGTVETISHAIKTLNPNINAGELSVCVYPTSVFLKNSDIVKAIEIYEGNNWDYIFSAFKPNSSPFRAFNLESNGGVKMLFPEFWSSRSQDLKECFNDAGQFYVANNKTWTTNSTIFSPSSTFIEIPSNQVIDINTEEDWVFAEEAFENMQRKSGKSEC